MERPFESQAESSAVSERPTSNISPDWQERDNTTARDMNRQSMTTAQATVSEHFGDLILERGHGAKSQKGTGDISNGEGTGERTHDGRIIVDGNVKGFDKHGDSKEAPGFKRGLNEQIKTFDMDGDSKEAPGFKRGLNEQIKSFDKDGDSKEAPGFKRGLNEQIKTLDKDGDSKERTAEIKDAAGSGELTPDEVRDLRDQINKALEEFRESKEAAAASAVDRTIGEGTGPIRPSGDGRSGAGIGTPSDRPQQIVPDDRAPGGKEPVNRIPRVVPPAETSPGGRIPQPLPQSEAEPGDDGERGARTGSSVGDRASAPGSTDGGQEISPVPAPELPIDDRLPMPLPGRYTPADVPVVPGPGRGGDGIDSAPWPELPLPGRHRGAGRSGITNF